MLHWAKQYQADCRPPADDAPSPSVSSPEHQSGSNGLATHLTPNSHGMIDESGSSVNGGDVAGEQAPAQSSDGSKTALLILSPTIAAPSQSSGRGKTLSSLKTLLHAPMTTATTMAEKRSSQRSRTPLSCLQSPRKSQASWPRLCSAPSLRLSWYQCWQWVATCSCMMP